MRSRRPSTESVDAVTDYDYDEEDDTINVPGTPEVERRRRRVRRLYGPDGQVLRSFSNRPPTGFHQGERGKS